MKHLSIIIPEEAVPASIVDPRYMFTAVNQFLEAEGEDPMFEVQLVGLSREVRLSNGIFSVHTDALIDEVKHTDLILIPALSGDLQRALEINKPFIPWILGHYNKGAEVASLCLGAFLLASTGLLNGKECSTHWLFAEQFRSMFPDVELVDGRIISEEQGIYSSGGAASYWNLLLHLVEKYANREMAIHAAKFFAIEIDRKSQSPFIMFNGQKKHEDEPIKEAQEYIEKNVSARISVEDLAVKFAIGRRHFRTALRRKPPIIPLSNIYKG